MFPGFSVRSLFVVEPVEDPAGDRFFGDHGLYAEELYAQYERGPVRVFGGKFDAAFGKAWDEAPGIYGVDFAEDYELVERVGFGAEISQEGTPFGKLALTAALFQADTSGFEQLRFHQPRQDRLRRRRAEQHLFAAESFSMVLADGSDRIPGAAAASAFNSATRHQAAGDPASPEDQNGYAATLTGTSSTWNSVGIAWIAESVIWTASPTTVR